MNDQKIVVDEGATEKIGADPEITNLLSKQTDNNHPFKLSGIVQDESDTSTPEVKVEKPAKTQTRSVIKGDENQEEDTDENAGSDESENKSSKSDKEKSKQKPGSKKDEKPLKKNDEQEEDEEQEEEDPADEEQEEESDEEKNKKNAKKRKGVVDFLDEDETESPEDELEEEDVESDDKNNKSKVVASKEVKQEIETLRKENAAFKAQIANPAMALALQLVTSADGDVKKIFSQFDVKDYDAMSPSDIKRLQLSSQNLTEDDIESEMKDFDALSDAKKKIEAIPLREQFKKGADEKNRKLLSATSITPQAKQHQKEQEQIAISSLDELTEKLATKGFKGFYELADGEVDLIKKYALKNPVVVTLPNGKQSYDMKATVDNAFWNVPSLRKNVIKVIQDIAREEGYERKIKERTRVSNQEFAPGSHTTKKTSFSDVMKGQKIVEPVEN